GGNHPVQGKNEHVHGRSPFVWCLVGARDTGDRRAFPRPLRGISGLNGGLSLYEGAPRYTVVVSMRRRRADEAGDRELAELAALADGSLEPERRAAVEARIAASPELADRLAEQERAVAFARNAAAEVEAPAGLRRRIEVQRAGRRAGAPGRLVLIG